MKLPARLPAESVTAIVDSREQTPLDLAPLRTVRGTLTTGDYSLVGSDTIRIERKSLPDLIACVGRERTRFDAEVDRLLAFPVRVLLVEATWEDIETGAWRGKITPEQAIGSLLGWQAKGLAVHMCGTHQRAGRHAARLLYTVARREWRRLRTLADGVGTSADS